MPTCFKCQDFLKEHQMGGYSCFNCKFQNSKYYCNNTTCGHNICEVCSKKKFVFKPYSQNQNPQKDQTQNTSPQKSQNPNMQQMNNNQMNNNQMNPNLRISQPQFQMPNKCQSEPLVQKTQTQMPQNNIISNQNNNNLDDMLAQFSGRERNDTPNNQYNQSQPTTQPSRFNNTTVPPTELKGN